MGLAAVGRGELAALSGRALVLDFDRIRMDLLRALGLVALPLRIVAIRRRLRMGLVVGTELGPGVGQLDVVARLCRLVSLRLLQFMVLAPLRSPLPRLLSTAPPPELPGWRGRFGTTATTRCHAGDPQRLRKSW